MKSRRSKNSFFLTLASIVFFGTFDGAGTEVEIRLDARDDTRPEVTMNDGTVRGIYSQTINNRTIANFLGVPYAEPPIEDLRFANPVAKRAWNGTLDTSLDGNACPQLSNGEFIGDENCLYLNVFTPQLPENERSTLLPVMVFIYGGGFFSGSGASNTYGGGYLLDKDVVLVVPNYRLGALGFLSTGDEISPGNYGLKDIVLALKWIQANVEYFGGDPERVTLVGQSAGAVCVHLLTLSESATGLFHGYVLESGSAYAPWTYRSRSVSAGKARQLGEFFDCNRDTSSNLIDCLRSLDAFDIVNATTYFYQWRSVPRYFWLPTDEVAMDGYVITESPQKLLSSGRTRDLPRIVGFNENEVIPDTEDAFDEFIEKIDFILPLVLCYADLAADEATVTTAIKSYYLNDLTADRALIRRNMTTMVGDVLFSFPTHQIVRQHTESSSEPLFFYAFNYRGTFSNSIGVTGTQEDLGACHTDELLYLFPQIEALYSSYNQSLSEADYQMTDTMVELWTSFATDGKPPISPVLANITWNPYTNLGDRLRIGNHSDPTIDMYFYTLEDRMAFLFELTDSLTSSSDRLTYRITSQGLLALLYYLLL